MKNKSTLVYLLIALASSGATIGFGFTSLSYPGLFGILSYSFGILALVFFAIAVINEDRWQ